MGLHDVPIFMSLFGFGIGMMLASFHVSGMMLLFSDVLYMLVRYASPSGPMCLNCLMLTLSGPVELLFLLLFYCRLDLCCGECYVGCLQFECFPVYVSVCFVCFMFDCVGELFVEYVLLSVWLR